jgi:hypothetical protein
MLSHVRCRECRGCYNGRTGSDNTLGITLYVVVSLVVVIALMVLFFICSGSGFGRR